MQSLTAYATLVFASSLGAASLVTLATVPAGCAVTAKWLLLASSLGWLFLLVNEDDGDDSV